MTTGGERTVLRLPVLRALLAQGVAVALVVVLVYLLALLPWRMSLFSVALLQGVLAAAIGWRLGLSRWWLWINLAFLPTLLLVQRADLPAWLFLLGFVLLLLINWNSLREQVPLYLSGRKAQQRLQQCLSELEQPMRFVDLGCGTAGALLGLARQFPRGQFVGVETAPLLFLLAWLRCLFQENCSIRYRSLWQVDLGEFDVVYCFLSPVPMPRLWAKAQAEMHAGSWLVSNTFDIPGVPADRLLEVNEGRQTSLFLWRIKDAPISARIGP
ncbi:class I SAM-dependent methyltransferase [Ectopseudomonas mendocina]|jgi:SAM-dependent methyltransferase|uniref:class I SAM-dependent methyltransferase n=1 Tax=Ectopseudomonas mendocina TaxID=300 RepID=UPI0005A10025|nr:class I SAM-dependent methyltransferase [Pseudomonas mendocina]